MNNTASTIYQTASRIKKGSRVLDIGSGNGSLSSLLLAMEKDVTIDAIELKEPDEKIKKLYRKLYCDSIENAITYLDLSQYDYIVMLDVLEHLYDPYTLLKEIYKLTTLQTTCIFSVPNIAHGSIILSLIDENFEYQNEGLLDRTHIRFFTKKTFLEIVNRIQFHTNEIITIQYDILCTKITISSSFINKIMYLFFLFTKQKNEFQYIFILSKNPTNLVENVVTAERTSCIAIKQKISFLLPALYRFLKKTKQLISNNKQSGPSK